MEQAVRSGMRGVVSWLLTGCVLIGCMVAIGGITRLTESGLSIVEWKPITGALPPLNEADWQVEFDKYKRIPEYQLINQGMDLDGFKRIYFWEWLHRNWGRLMGLVFIVPFLWFWRRGALTGWLRTRTLWILAGGAAVAGLGWFMVASGLEKNVDVSHYRLAIHLCAAFSVFGLVLWTVFDILRGRRSFGGDGSGAARGARWLLALLALQIVYGAFTAGLDAGHVANTWPLMNGRFLSEQAFAYTGTWADLVDHREGVQFIHRNLAWLVAAAFLGFAWRHRGHAALQGAERWLALAVVLQFVLGVLTLITQVDIVLGVLHQSGALVLLAALLNVLHRSGRISAT
jgi:cytochrome c oxidase assembly protein subunit 15